MISKRATRSKFIAIKVAKSRYNAFVNFANLCQPDSNSIAKKRMSAKAFFDTNVLIHAFVQNDQRTAEAEALLAGGGTISVQILNEFVAVAVRKLGWRGLRCSTPWLRFGHSACRLFR